MARWSAGASQVNDNQGNGPKFQQKANQKTKTLINEHEFFCLFVCLFVFVFYVVAWGGNSSQVKGDLKRVIAISSTAHAFAATTIEGRVVTWGDSGLFALRSLFVFFVVSCLCLLWFVVDCHLFV